MVELVSAAPPIYALDLMTAEDLAHMFANDGIYILGDTRLPGTTMPVLVMGTVKGEAGIIKEHGRAWTLAPNDELRFAPGAWQETQVYLVGGPFSVTSCSQMRQEADSCTERHSLMESQIASLRAILGQCAPILDAYSRWIRAKGLKTEALRAEGLLNQIQELKTP